jgi:transposase
MRRIREILRLRREQGLSVRETARALGVSVGVVSKTAARAEKAGITWMLAEGLSDTALEERLYGRPASPSDDRPRPNPVHLHTELRRPGVTLEVLHLEYLERHPTGLRYTAFCDVYRRWLATASVTMRQVHKAGEKCFVDYSGKTLSFVDPTTGQRVPVELFVAVLGASNLTYAEATLSQKVQDFVLAHVHALTYFGGAPAIWVPDQLRSAVVVSCRYEPGIQRTYADFARHYDSAVVPARPYKPRDKAKVEAAVLVVQRWILARLRNETFFSLESLNRRGGARGGLRRCRWRSTAAPPSAGAWPFLVDGTPLATTDPWPSLPTPAPQAMRSIALSGRSSTRSLPSISRPSSTKLAPRTPAACRGRSSASSAPTLRAASTRTASFEPAAGSAARTSSSRSRARSGASVPPATRGACAGRPRTSSIMCSPAFLFDSGS